MTKPIDKPVQSDIMTSGEKEHGSGIRHNESDSSPGAGVSAERRVSPAEGKFALTVHGQAITERPDASEAFKKAVETAPVETDPTKPTVIAQYKGFDVRVLNMGGSGGYSISIRNPETGKEYPIKSVPYNELTAGVLTRVENRVSGIPNDLEGTKREIDQNRINLKAYQKQLSRNITLFWLHTSFFSPLQVFLLARFLMLAYFFPPILPNDTKSLANFPPSFNFLTGSVPSAKQTL